MPPRYAQTRREAQRLPRMPSLTVAAGPTCGARVAALTALADGYEKRFAPEASFAASRGVLTS